MFRSIIDSGQGHFLSMPGLTGDGSPWNWWGFSSAVFVSAVGFSVWPHLFMRSFAAKSPRKLRLSIVLYPTFMIFLVPILIIGFSAIVMFPGVEQADSILPYVLMQLELPAIVIGLFCAGALAASMSSGDAILHSAASIGTRDGISKILPHKPADQTERMIIRVLVIVIGLVAYVFAVLVDVSLVGLLLGSYGGVAQIFPIVCAMFYWKRATKAGAIAGLCGGLIVNTLYLMFPDWKPLPMHEGMYGLAANLILLIGVSLLTKPDPEATVRKFMERD